MTRKSEESRCDRAYRVRDMIQEKLSSLSRNREPGEEYSGLFYRIGEKVPEKYVLRALGSTLDMVLRKPLNWKREEAVVRAYFLATLRALCKEHKVETQFKGWYANRAGEK